VIKNLTDDAQNSHITSGMSQGRLQPRHAVQPAAGPVKSRIGGEAYRVSMYELLAQGQARPDLQLGGLSPVAFLAQRPSAIWKPISR